MWQRLFFVLLTQTFAPVPSFTSPLPISGPSLDMANNSKYVLIAISDNKCSRAKVLSNFTELLMLGTAKIETAGHSECGADGFRERVQRGARVAALAGIRI